MICFSPSYFCLPFAPVCNYEGRIRRSCHDFTQHVELIASSNRKTSKTHAKHTRPTFKNSFSACSIVFQLLSSIAAFDGATGCTHQKMAGLFFSSVFLSKKYLTKWIRATTDYLLQLYLQLQKVE